MGIGVLLIDDHAIVREGYRRLIEKHSGIAVVAEADGAASGYEAFKTSKPDVVVMDVSMPGRGGIDLVRQIRQLDSSARILIFTMHASAISSARSASLSRARACLFSRCTRVRSMRSRPFEQVRAAMSRKAARPTFW